LLINHKKNLIVFRFDKKDCAALSLKILGCMCRFRMNFFPTAFAHTQYILMIIKGLSSILRDKTVNKLKKDEKKFKNSKKIFFSFLIKFCHK